MKRFIIITGTILLFVILLFVALNLYFTDERLKKMILPRVGEAVGREVEADHLSLTLFRTFPNAGIQIDGFLIPGEADEPVAEFESLIASVHIFPLLRSDISVGRLEIDRPVVNYRVYEDGSSNLDFFFDRPDERVDTEENGVTLNIPRVEIRQASLFFNDQPNRRAVYLEGLESTLSLQYAEQIETRVEAELRSLTVRNDDRTLISGLPIRLSQISTLDLGLEELMLEEGSLSIRGLELALSGSFKNWTGDTPSLDFSFRSASEDFSELLRLAPPEYEASLADLESRGSLRLEGRVSGEITEGQIPEFNLIAEVRDGYLKNPDLAEPIEEIHFSLTADNQLIRLEPFTATAAGNRIDGNGTIERPLDEDARFFFHLAGDVDLESVGLFYPLADAGIETLNGLMSLNAEISGELRNLDEAAVSGHFLIQQGVLKFTEAPRPIEAITADFRGDQQRIDIRSASMSAEGNRLSLQGFVSEPLGGSPFIDLRAELEIDLGTLSRFYPIDEDTLAIRGKLSAQAHIQGRTDYPKNLLTSSRFELQNGYLNHQIVARPLEEISFIGSASSEQIDIQDGRFRSGENRISMGGRVSNYMEEVPFFDVTIDGTGNLADLTAYYSLEPWIDQLSGHALMNFRAVGPAGDPRDIALNGRLELSDVSASGDSLDFPVTDMRGSLLIEPESMRLEEFFMYYGSSDFALEGVLSNYLAFLNESPNETELPEFRGTWHSRLLNWDEFVDWDEEAEVEPIPIHLPRLNSQINATIETIMLFGVPIRQVTGSGRTTPDRIYIDQATAELFGGTASGELEWRVPRPDRTELHFSGRLDSLQASAFFDQYQFLGEQSRLHQFLSGGFSAQVEYATELDRYLDPVIASTQATGTFGMDRARLRDHPVQRSLSSWLGVAELNNLALDEWTAQFVIEESVLRLDDFRITSENLGLYLDGTHQLENNQVDFTAQLHLPPRFRRGIASVISEPAVDALSQEDGIIVVPIQITGTMDQPRISPRQSVIEELLRDAGRDVLRRLLDRVN